MPTKVRFRFNATTGEIEEFIVDDQNRSLPEVEHDERARVVGRMIATDPRIVEVEAGSASTRRTEKARDAVPPTEKDAEEDEVLGSDS
jgi:hypothetical protein